MTVSNVNATHFPLTEHEITRVPTHAFPYSVGEQLWQLYDAQGGKVKVAFPSPKTNNQWEIIPGSWVGTIPITPTCHFILQPKTPLKNIFRMWEFAYRLQSFHFLDNLITVSSLPDFFDHLANLLATLILHRGRLGFHRTYNKREMPLAYLRGRLLPDQTAMAATAGINCRFDKQSIDVADNQLLLFTLDQIAGSGLCRPHTQQMIRRAYHLMAGTVTLRPFSPLDCYGRSYTRLNEDYRPMHALCRFFLEHAGPIHHQGEHVMKPFLVNMAQLFEQFVAAWLKANLPPPWQLNVQESVTIGTHNELRFDIDLVLYDENGRPWAVLDTKYKTKDKAAPADIHQIITYAKAKQAPNAVLIYPAPIENPLQVQFGDIHLQTLTFSLAGSLQQAGQQLLDTLFAS